jgi:phosphoenolpyruvate synthase/pyruvate phosphate dikinase
MFTKTLKQISKEDIRIAGGKGAHLGKLMKTGIRVPDGFVVLSSAFDEFIANKKISKDLEREIQNAFDKLGEKYVAVRSSATAEDSKKDAWAGQLETYLYTTRKNLIKNIRKCWLSLFSPRAISYRKERKLQNKKISVAVVVQKMIKPEVSGVCFTVHPVTKNKNQMAIELVRGLGEKLVQGLITPDSYVISKKPLKIVRKNRQGKEKLSDKKIIDLAKICVRIEKHFKKPQDIEWTLEKGKFYIIQSRPITTL